MISLAKDSAAATVSGQYSSRISRRRPDVRSIFSTSRAVVCPWTRQGSLSSSRPRRWAHSSNLEMTITRGRSYLLPCDQPRMTADLRGRLGEDRLLAAHPAGARPPSRPIAATTDGAEPRVLRRIEQEEQGPRLRQMPCHRARGGIPTRPKVLARVVVEAKHPRQSCRVAAGTSRLRLHGKQEGTGIADRPLSIGDGVVELP